nr:GRCD5 protein [Tanacetum cinerariifolium]
QHAPPQHQTHEAFFHPLDCGPTLQMGYQTDQLSAGAAGPNDVCLDQASREDLEEHDSHGDMEDKIIGCNEDTNGIVLDSEVVNVQNEDDGIRGVENDRKVNFGSYD